MSIVEPTLYSLARATVVAGATLAVLLAAGPGIRAVPRRTRSLVFWIATVALLAPGFVSAYVLLVKAAKLDVFRRELLYCALTGARYASLALLAVWLMPPSLSSEAMHCLRQSARVSWWRRRVWELRAWGRGLWLGIVVVFLLSFQEFDFATTWNMRAWTVALFDAQAGGLALGESLRLAALPFIVQVILITVFVLNFRPVGAAEERGRSTGRAAIIILLILVPYYLLMMMALLAVISSSMILYLGGSRISEFAPSREVANGLGLAFAATVFAWLAAGWISARRGWRWLFALPGLLGPLLCGLMLLAVMQLPPLHLLRDTLFPTILGLALVLLPFALLLRFGIETTRDNAALHIARASGARRAVWLLDGFPRLCALLLLFCFGYGDFTINSLLAPPAFTSATVRLLNLLHYGQSAALAVMIVLSFAVPLTAALLTAALARLYARRRVR
jgi:hypothetical protein